MNRINNLIKACQGIHHQLSEIAQKPSLGTKISPRHREWHGVYAEIKGLAARVEEVCRKHGITPAHLPTPSRRAYSWLHFLGELDAEENWRLTQHLETLALAYQALQHNYAKAVQSRSGIWKHQHPMQVQLSIYYSSQLFQARYQPPRLEITFHEGFIGAPPQIIDNIIKIALRLSSDELLKQVRHYSHSEAFQEIATLLGEMSAAVAQRGKVYDLDEVFDCVNKTYFGSQLSRPNLVWGDRLTRRKYGHYQPLEDTLLISRTLDNNFIPRYFIEFIMYHELLHKALGAKFVNGRRYVHTSEFRAAEKKFKKYDKAQAYMTQLAKTFRQKPRIRKTALLRKIRKIKRK